MKKFLIILILFSGCASGLNLPKAKQLVESLIKKTDSGDYEGISQFYTYELNSGEPIEVRTEKLKKLKAMFGDVQSFELIESKDITYNDFPALLLKYIVRGIKMTSIQEFTVIRYEGDYKVARQNIVAVK